MPTLTMSGRLLNELPTELKLRLVENCDLKALIKLRTISQSWRALVMRDQRVRINMTRRKLLDFYDFCLDSQYFCASREHIIPSLKSFDRKSYIGVLSARGLPEEFEMWIREWPEKAAIGCLWPGMDELSDSDSKQWWRPCVRNLLNSDYIKASSAVDKAVQHNITVEREQQGPMHIVPHFTHESPDFAAIAIPVQRASWFERFGPGVDYASPMAHDHIDQQKLNPLFDPLGEVLLVVADGGPWNGTVHYSQNTANSRSYVLTTWQSPVHYVSSWIEFMKYQLGAYEQACARFNRPWNGVLTMTEYYHPIHDRGTMPKGEFIDLDGHIQQWSRTEPSPVFKHMLPIFRADGTTYFRGITLPQLPSPRNQWFEEYDQLTNQP